MKYTPNIVSKNIITTYARKIRNVQSEQIDPYIELIEQELIKVYPELKDREDNALNWAYDIINAESDVDVAETLNRVDTIITNERKSKWICGFVTDIVIPNIFAILVMCINDRSHVLCITNVTVITIHYIFCTHIIYLLF